MPELADPEHCNALAADIRELTQLTVKKKCSIFLMGALLLHCVALVEMDGRYAGTTVGRSHHAEPAESGSFRPTAQRDSTVIVAAQQ